MPEHKPHESASIPVVEETLHVRPERTATGGVRVRVQPGQRTVQMPLESWTETTQVERLRVDRPVKRRRAPWREGDTLVVPVYEERATVTRELVLVEEVRLRTVRQQRQEQAEVQLRHDQARVERRTGSGAWVVDDEARERTTTAATPKQPSPRQEFPMRQTVVGVFDRYAAAQQAAATLQARGIASDCIHVTSADETGDDTTATGTRREEGGVLNSVKNFFSDLFGTEEHADVNVYSEAVRRGGAVVKVDIDDESQTELARTALQDAGAVDIDADAAATGSTQTFTTDTTTTGTSTAGTAAGRTESVEGPSDVLPVVQEEMAVGTRTVRTGGVRVYTRTVSEPVSESVQLHEERAVVDRRPADRPATEAELDSMKDRTVEVTESAERPVVEKRARVVEEVVVGKEVRDREAKIEETLRHTEVEVERMPGETGATGSARWDEAPFREHYTQHYAAQGGRWEDYEPAYRYGHSARTDTRYAGRKWEDVEPDLRLDWTQKNPNSPWERAKDAVRHSWNRITQ